MHIQPLYWLFGTGIGTGNIQTQHWKLCVIRRTRQPYILLWIISWYHLFIEVWQYLVKYKFPIQSAILLMIYLQLSSSKTKKFVYECSLQTCLIRKREVRGMNNSNVGHIVWHTPQSYHFFQNPMNTTWPWTSTRWISRGWSWKPLRCWNFHHCNGETPNTGYFKKKRFNSS